MQLIIPGIEKLFSVDRNLAELVCARRQVSVEVWVVLASFSLLTVNISLGTLEPPILQQSQLSKWYVCL